MKRDDIKNYDGWYWAEVSDAIEHYFKKFKGYPIPNTYASILLGKDVDLLEDGAHYQRPIGLDKNIYTKVIYGFRDKQLYDAVMKNVDDYEQFMEKINGTLDESLTSLPHEIYMATYLIENIYRAHYEDEINEMLPHWADAVVDAVNRLKTYPETSGNEELSWYMEMGQYLLHEMPVLELHQISAEAL